MGVFYVFKYKKVKMKIKNRFLILFLFIFSLVGIVFFAWRVIYEKYMFGIVGLVSQISLFALAVIVYKQSKK